MFPSSNAAVPSTRFYAQGSLFVATHSSNTEYVRPSSSKAAREERGLSPVPISHEGEHPKATKERSRKMKSKFNAMFNGVDMKLLNPANFQPVMFTLKYSGCNKRRFNLAPNDLAVNEHIHYFETYMSEQAGSPIKWMWFKDTNTKAQGVHMHGLMFPQGPMKDEAQFGLSLEQIIHEEWAIASGQFDKEADFDPTHLYSPISHIKYGTSFADTAAAVSAFALYEGHKKDEETGKWKPKVAQKKTDALWLATGNYRVRWAGISAALTPAKLDLDLEIKCDCGVADAYAAAQKFSAAERKFMTFPSRVKAGEVIQLDTARFSMDFLKRGGMEFGRVSPELIASIESIAEAHAGCSPVTPAAADETTAAAADASIATTEQEEATMTDANNTFLTIEFTVPTSRRFAQHAANSPEMKLHAWARLDEKLFEIQHSTDCETLRGLRVDRNELLVKESDRTDDSVTITGRGSLVPRRGGFFALALLTEPNECRETAGNSRVTAS